MGVEREKTSTSCTKSKGALYAANIECIPSDTHIIPVLIGNSAICKVYFYTQLLNDF